MLNQLLEDYGLSKTEAQSYLTVLELGSAPVSSIARRSGENRVTVYSALKSLVKKGIATEINKNKTTNYSVVSPEVLMKKTEEKYQAIKEALPQFMAIANKYDNKPKVQFFDGMEGLKQLYDDILETENLGICAFLGAGKVSPKLADHLNLHFLPKRVKLNIHAKVLLSEDEKNKQVYKVLSKKAKETLTQYQVVHYDSFHLSNEIDIYGKDKVAIMMFTEEEMSGLIIQSKQLHDNMKSIFDLAWFASTCLLQKNHSKTTKTSVLPRKSFQKSKKKKLSKESS